MCGNENASKIRLAKVLENVRSIREQYENRVEEHPIWESNVHNSIGLSSKFSTCQSNWWLIVFIVNFSAAVSTVVRHLLNLNFWVTSLQANNESLFFGNLTTNYALLIALENFSVRIDYGSPTPNESGEKNRFTQYINHSQRICLLRRVLSWTLEFQPPVRDKWTMSTNYVTKCRVSWISFDTQVCDIV